MIKKLAVLCTFAIFMLAVGGAVTPVWAHADCGPGGKGKHSDKHPHCGVVNEDSTDDGSLYLVWVDGEFVDHVLVDGVWVDHVWVYGVCEAGYWVNGVCEDGRGENYDLGIPPYIGHDPVGKKEEVTVNFQYINMDLSYIQEWFLDGDACFAEAPVEGRQTVLSIGHDKSKALVAWYVFSGFGTDETPKVGYRLTLSSTENDVPFPSGWRPTQTTTTETGDRHRFDVTFNHWELSSKKDIACTGSGWLENPTTISIIKTN